MKDAKGANVIARQMPMFSGPVPVSGTDEWYTPAEYIESARAVMGGIDLDPASSDLAQEVVRAGAYFTVQDDGLRQPFFGRVWLNPPYSGPEPWVMRALDDYRAGQIEAAVILLNNATETVYGQELLAAGPVCFPKGRIPFWRWDPHIKASGNRNAQMIGYLGPQAEDFCRVFGQWGVVKP